LLAELQSAFMLDTVLRFVRMQVIEEVFPNVRVVFGWALFEGIVIQSSGSETASLEK
jgi:hypothetical protein